MYDVAELVREPLLLDPLRRAVRDDAPPAYLRSAKMKLTARCNLKCVMCKYGRGLVLPELGTARVIHIVRQMAQLGCRKIHFSGGEVLARTDFEEIVAAAADARLKVAFTSNLTLLTKARAKALMRSKVSSISTSLDGATAKTHDRIRGVDGAFKKTLRGLRLIIKERERRGRRTKVRINFVMMRDNFRQYADMVWLAAEHGAVELHPMPVDDKSAARHRLSKRLIREYNDEIAPRVRDAREQVGFCTDDAFVYPFGRTGAALGASARGDYAQGYYEAHRCHAPWTHLFVAWDGKVYLCCMTNGRIRPLGDLSIASVREVFLGPAFAEARLTMKRERFADCRRCDMLVPENRVLDRAMGIGESGAVPARRLRVVS